MTDLIKFGKKFFTFSVVAMTIVWSVGVAALVPAVAVAVDCPELEAGDLFKVPDDSAVYFVNADMERMYFFNSEVYKTWFEGWSGVVEIDPSCTSAYPSGGGVSYLPGSLMVKTTISPDVFAILPDAELMKIADEAAATALYGEGWAGLVRDVPAIYFDTYTQLEGSLDGTEPHNGQLVSKDGEDTVYKVVDGMLYSVDGDLASYVSVRTLGDAVVDALEVAEGNVTSASLVEDPGQKEATEAGEEADEEADEEEEVVVSSLGVSLSANTPDAGKVVVNVDGVVFSKFVFKAGADADAKVNSLKIGRQGLGATSDFSSVTLYDGATKLGSTKTSWHSDGYMTYNVSGGWTIPAGESKELTMVAKLGSGSTGTYNALGILEATVSNGAASGVPVYGNEMTGISVTVGTVTIDEVGNNATKNIGTNGVTLASFKLTINGTENSSFESITLKNKAATNNGSDRDLANMYLYKGAELLAGPVSMVSDKITFDLDEPYEIKKSKNETFKVVGDVVNGSGNTIEFLLDDTTDLTVVGATYNTPLSVTATAFDAAGEGFIITIAGAELNIAYSGEQVETADDRTDVSFGKLTLGAGSTDIKITNLVLTIDETANDGDVVLDVDEFEMVDDADGDALSGAMTNGGDGNADDETWTFTDEIYLEAGKSRTFTLRGDIPNNSTSSDYFQVKIGTINTTAVTAETVPEGDAVSNFSIGSFTGKTVTVKKPTLTVLVANQQAGNNVANDEDVILYQGTMEASAGDITVQVADFDHDSYFATSNWTQVGFYLLKNGEYLQQQLITNSQMTSGTLAFDAMDFVVESGPENKATFVLMGTVAGTIDAGNNVAHLQLDYIDAKDSDNDNPTITGAAGSEDFLSTGSSNLTTVRQTTLRGTGILYLQMRNIDAGFNKDRVMLAGTSEWVGKLRIRAQYEDIKLVDLKLTNNTGNGLPADSFGDICLYTEQVASLENQIGCATMSSSTVFYNDINKVVEVGTHDWYIYANSQTMDDGASGTADSHDVLDLFINTTTGMIVASGVDSATALALGNWDGTNTDEADILVDYNVDDIYADAAPDHQTTTTMNYYIAGSKISNVELVDSYGGEVVDTLLAGTGEYTAMILAITTEDNDNTDSNGNPLRVAIDALRFDATLLASTTLSGITLERIGGTQGAKALRLSSNTGSNSLTSVSGTAGFAVTSSMETVFSNDSKIDAGDTAYFVLKATVNALTAASETINWFQFRLADVKGSFADANNNIDWKDGYSSTNYDYLFLDTTVLIGTKIAEAT